MHSAGCCSGWVFELGLSMCACLLSLLTRRGGEEKVCASHPGSEWPGCKSHIKIAFNFGANLVQICITSDHAHLLLKLNSSPAASQSHCNWNHSVYFHMQLVLILPSRTQLWVWRRWRILCVCHILHAFLPTYCKLCVQWALLLCDKKEEIPAMDILMHRSIEP